MRLWNIKWYGSIRIYPLVPMIKQFDTNGEPIRLHTYEEGYISWQPGKDGRIHFGHAETPSLNIRYDPQFQVIVRAPDRQI